MVDPDQAPRDFIAQLSNLNPKLFVGNDETAQMEALWPSRQLTTSLEELVDVAVDLPFSVRRANPKFNQGATREGALI